MFDFIKNLFGKKTGKNIELAPEDMAAELIRTAVDIIGNTVHDVFVYYHPHVHWLDVYVHIDGWIEGQTAHKHFFFPLDNKSEFNKCMDYLKELQLNGFFWKNKEVFFMTDAAAKIILNSANRDLAIRNRMHRLLIAIQKDGLTINNRKELDDILNILK